MQCESVRVSASQCDLMRTRCDSMHIQSNFVQSDRGQCNPIEVKWVEVGPRGHHPHFDFAGSEGSPTFSPRSPMSEAGPGGKSGKFQEQMQKMQKDTWMVVVSGLVFGMAASKT